MPLPNERRDPRFRLAVESDADTLLEFMQAYYAFDGHGFDREKARVALTALLRDSSLGLAWLILDGDAAVGYIVLCFGYSLEWLGRDAFVDEFYLREEYRGRGWGRQAMAFLEESARAAGIRTLASRSRRGKHLRAAVIPEAGLRRTPQHVPVEMDRAGSSPSRAGRTGH